MLPGLGSPLPACDSLLPPSRERRAPTCREGEIFKTSFKQMLRRPLKGRGSLIMIVGSVPKEKTALRVQGGYSLRTSRFLLRSHSLRAGLGSRPWLLSFTRISSGRRWRGWLFFSLRATSTEGKNSQKAETENNFKTHRYLLKLVYGWKSGRKSQG